MCFLVKSFGFLPGPNLYGCEITLPVTTGRYHEGIGVLSGGLGFVTLPSTMVSTWLLAAQEMVSQAGTHSLHSGPPGALTKADRPLAFSVENTASLKQLVLLLQVGLGNSTAW